MAFNPKDALSSASEIASGSVKKAAEIVENSTEILKGNVGEGVTGIVKNATEIAENAVEKGKEILTGKDDDSAE